jgi:hypothetical protein
MTINDYCMTRDCPECPVSSFFNCQKSFTSPNSENFDLQLMVRSNDIDSIIYDMERFIALMKDEVKYALEIGVRSHVSVYGSVAQELVHQRLQIF